MVLSSEEGGGTGELWRGGGCEWWGDVGERCLLEERMRANIHARRSGIWSDEYRIVGVGVVREARLAQRWIPQLKRSF